jgi:hypothetical protein
VSGLRNDSLALFMHHANVVSGSSCLVFEDTKGIVLSAATKRLNKNGLITIQSNERSFQSFPYYQMMQHSAEEHKCVRFENMKTIQE